VDISILSEHEIETYATPEKKIKQRVIVYQAEGFAPRTIWTDSEKLPDVVYQAKNPGKAVPANVLAAGDVIRRTAVEADIARIKQAPQPRKI
jgi:hypothetical protein